MYNTFCFIVGRLARMSAGASVIVVAMLVASCGGGGGGDLPPERTDRVISGVGFDGPIINGNVKIYDFSSGAKDEKELIGQGTTDESGRYRVTLRVGSRPILIEITGGRYIEEATGEVVNFGEADVLRAVYNYQYEENTERQVAVTFYTHVAAGLADYLIRKGGVAVAEAIDQANEDFSNILGVDITQVLPLDVTASASQPKDDPNTADVDESTVMSPGVRYGFMTAAISQWTEWASRQNGAEQPHGLFTSLFFAQRAYEDIQWDGELNGQKEGGPIAFRNVAVDGGVYRNGIALNMLAMASSPRNATGFDASAVRGLAEAYNNSNVGEGLFGGAAGAPFAEITPTITIIAPEDGKVLAGTFTAAANIVDQVGVQSVIFYVDDQQVGVAEDPNQPTVTISSVPLEDGEHTLMVEAINGLANSARVTSSFIVANKGTMIGNVKPADGAFVRGTFTMSVDVVDPVGVRSVVFTDDAGNSAEAQDPQNPSAEMNTQVSGKTLADGRHAFKATATNNVGSKLEKSVNYTVDNAAPQVTLNGVASGAFVKGTVRVTGSAADANLDRAQLLVDGDVHTEFTSGFTSLAAQVDTTTIEDGQRPFVLRANDKAGNVAEKSVAAVVDNTAPSIRILSPAPNDTVSGSFVFSAQVLDPVSRVKTVEVRFNGGNPVALTPDSNGNVTRTIDVKNLSDSKAVSITASDNAANRSEASVTVRVDNNAPSVVIDGLANDQVVRGAVNVTVSAQAAGGVRLVDFKVDGNGVASFSSNFDAMAYTIDTDALSEGDHLFTVSVFSQGSVNATVTRRFIVDRTNPVINIGLPSPGDWLGASVMVSGQLNEPNLASAMVSIAGKSQSLDDVAGDFSASFDVTGSNGRDQTLEVSATDKAGNATRQTVTVNIDTNEPNITDLSPADGTQVQGTFRVAASAQDGDGSGVAGGTFFFADLVKPATRDGDQWVAEFSAAGLGGGDHVLEFEAIDAVGNRSERVSRKLVTDSTPPQIEITSLEPGTTVAEGTLVQLRASITDAASAVEAVTLTVNGDDHPINFSDGTATAEIPTEGRRGELTLALQARDTAGNTSQPTTMRVTVVDAQPPVLTLNAPAPQEATNKDGARVAYSVSATDDVDGEVRPSCEPRSESVFPVGETTVNCTAKDKQGNEATGSFVVIVRDTTKPTVNVPGDISAAATRPDGAEVNYNDVTATDLVDGKLTADCNPTSGSLFPMGATTVTCTATDTAGNNSEPASFQITVSDTTAPTLTVPDNMTEEASGPNGAAVTYDVTAQDAVYGDVTPTCTLGESSEATASGDTYPIGETTVTCVAADAQNNIATDSFVITVRDSTSPTLTVTANVVEIPATRLDGASVDLAPNLTAQDDVDPSPVVTCRPESGSLFPIADTEVRCVATDDAGNDSSEATFTVRVTEFVNSN